MGKKRLRKAFLVLMKLPRYQLPYNVALKIVQTSGQGSGKVLP